MLLHNLHGPYDGGLLAVGVVEESQVALLHGPEVVAGYVVTDPCVYLVSKTSQTDITRSGVQEENDLPSQGSGPVLAARSSIENLTSTPFVIRVSGSAFKSQ